MPGSKKAESLFKTLFGRVLKRQDVLAADLMALDLRYNSPQTGTSLGATALFNGNISQMMWASTGSAPEQAGYGFTYDGLNRLRSANYAEGTSYTSGTGKFSTAYSYDANGNMSTLTRNLDGAQVDNLTYAYISNGNRLQSVSDGTASPLGYKAVTGSYLYDNNGNMVKDISKGFTIAYNSLNLPQLVSSVNDYARYTYDAAGTKLAKTITNGSASTVRTDYSGPFMYENSVLKCIFTPEGRIVPLNSNGAMSYSYEYNLKDHLGNTRVTFTGHGYGRPEVNLLTSYDPYGLVTSQTSFYPTGASKNKLLYNGKEFQDDVLAGSKIDWFDYGARMYDPELGRWHSMDMLSESFFRHSPYSYSFNNPIKYYDPNGMWPSAIHNIMLSNIGSLMTKNDLSTLMWASKEADAQKYQGPEVSFRHAMGQKGLSPSKSIYFYNKFINDQFGLALKASSRTEGLKELGFALHAIMDNSSPTHKGFQVWKGIKEEECFGAVHWLGEQDGAYFDPVNRPDIILAIQEMKTLYELFDQAYGKSNLIGEVIVTAKKPEGSKSIDARIQDMLWESERPNAYGNTGKYNQQGRSTDQYYSDDFLKWYYGK